MRYRTKGALATLAVTVSSLVTVSAAAQEDARHEKAATVENRGVQGYANPTEQDIVEWLPARPADHRIRYGNDPLQFGDLRLPDRTAPDGHPVLVYVHGGAWLSNWNMDHSDPLIDALSDAGIATWSLEYRRVGNNGGAWPGTFLDIAAGVDHLRELADEYNLDLDRVVVAGHSAGGHLAQWAAARHKIPQDSALYTANPLRVSGTVSLAGSLDMEWRLQRSQTIRDLHGVETAEEGAPLLPLTSPMHMLPLGVPMEVIVGSEDSTGLVSDARRYSDLATQAGDTVDFSLLEGANHFDVVDPCGPAWPTVAEAIFERLGYDAPRATLIPGQYKGCPLS